MGIEKDLTGGSRPESLDRDGWSLTAPGVYGRLRLTRPPERGAGTRAPDLPSEELDAALRRAGLEELASLELVTDRVEPAPEGERLRAPTRDGDALELAVPDLDGAAQVLLVTDEAGMLSWHFPTDSPAWPEDQRVTRSGGGATVTFRVPTEPVPVPPPDGRTDRSLVGALGKKVLKVLFYELGTRLMEAGIEAYATRWEDEHRPHRLTRVTPDDYRSADRPAVGGEDWGRLRAGRTLLFVHGTFSTTQAAFHDIPPDAMRRLHETYGGRVIAFDHPTLSRAPTDNVRWLLDPAREHALPAGTTLDVDVICHSRGGLVARVLGQEPRPFGLPGGGVRVHKTVFCGVPNQGTILTEPDHVPAFLDRLTNLVNLAPLGVVGDVLDGVLTAVKVVGRGALEALDGLVSMRPSGAFLEGLNGACGHGDYYAVAAEYEPADPGVVRLVKGAGDAVVDRIFRNVANDLVVPEPGVYADNGASGFPIAGDRLLRLPPDRGAMHTSLFAQDDVVRRLLGWLEATDG